MIVFNNNEGPCPCGSGTSIPKCCLRPHGLLPPQVVTKPTTSPTGFSHPKCYASALNDCCSEIDREHYVSESVLRQINWKGTLFVGGLGKKFKPRTMSPKGAMNASILCKRHNSILSGLDTLAARFYSALTFPDQADRCSNPEVSLFNGHDIERLMTKMLCGSFASDGEWKPPLPVLKAMFGDNALPDGCGLYISPNNGQATFGARGISITPVTDGSGNIMGGGFID